MQSIFAKLLYMNEKQHDTVLVTIIAAHGSAPRGCGAQMLVGQRGRLTGTIGGGTMEYRAEQLAIALLEKKESQVHTFPLHENSPDNIGMVCGGDVTVHLQYIPWQDATWNTLAATLLLHLKNHQRGWLVLRLDGGAPALISADHACEIPDNCLLQDDQIVIPLPIAQRAIVFGAGHCARALSPLLQSVGFRVTIFDERASLTNAANFPTAEQLIVGDYGRISDYISLTPQDYVVVMTSGHRHDFQVQQQILRQKLAYVGVIGSRSKTAAVHAQLRQVGISDEAIASVHSPIGTAIKAVTPEEIAVSIAGEMIYVRACQREAAENAAPHF